MLGHHGGHHRGHYGFVITVVVILVIIVIFVVIDHGLCGCYCRRGGQCGHRCDCFGHGGDFLSESLWVISIWTPLRCGCC